jgi:hypothetical protein
VLFIPDNGLETRMIAGFDTGIVIPVVVGSSPISHPIKYRASLSADAIIFD